MNDFIKMFKENKRLSYAVNIFILLVVISLILKVDFTKFSKETDIKLSYQESEVTVDSYVYNLEKRLEKILEKIDGIKSVDVMIYTKETPILEPVYDENITNDSNVEVTSDGSRREVNRETKQNKVILGRDNSVVEQYYQYPEIHGVLVVANYGGSKDIYSILMNSVRTLLNIKLNDIEIIVIN
ncbi:MAG: hypothetical protein GX339_01515 [Tissierellia bacterium]|nr:hypothetical protein [Tissierellia bacterium]